MPRWTDRQVRRISTYVENPRDYWYKEVIRSILESGSLYTAAVIATMVGSSVVTNGSTIFGYIDAIIVCIVPTLLVLLLHMNRVRAMERRPKQTAASTGIRFSPMGNFSSSASQTGLELLEIGQDGGDVSLNGENQA
ncbi:hypothetical protein FRB96_003794 [Tulasnella sp. 330]|nr:hypothetical protein FRB96_003794 [Tulasnella sp. 330]KAG8888394.1 hypothetical protein FRB98_007689 [Tulasnella sp. 332]